MADILDIFNNNAFSVVSLAGAMRDIKYVPSYISSLNLFRTQVVSTTSVAIEKDADQQIFIVRSSPRGGPGQTFGKSGRNMRILSVPHFQVDDAIYADEVQNVRAMGDAAALETLQQRIATRGGEVSQSFALTEEYHKLSVITQGKLLDKDGSVLYDYYGEFGQSAPAEIDFDLDNANPSRGALRKLAASVVRQMSAALDGIPYTGILAICGDAFWDDLIVHNEVEKTYLNWTAAAELRTNIVSMNSIQNGIYGAMSLFDIYWVNYRGGQSVGVDTNKAYFVPLGTPDLFRSVYAPADYIETVNRPGQRLYSKVWRMPNDKGMNMEFQSNVLHYVTRPNVIIRAKRT